MTHDIQANISKFEFEAIQKMRAVSKHGWGSVHLTYVRGVCLNIETTYTDDREKLIKLQK